MKKINENIMEIINNLEEEVFERYYDGEITLDKLLGILNSIRVWYEIGLNLIKRIGIKDE